MFNNLFFENLVIYEIMWKNIVERGRPQMTIWLMRLACWYLRLQIHTLKLCNTHCSSTATMVERTCLNVTLYVFFLSYIYIYIYIYIYAYYTLTSKRLQNSD